MAVVKLGSKVKTNLAGTIRYVINPIKNGGGRLVYASYSHERHDANMLAEPMIHDLERCANGLRANGVLALHLKHTFSPDENVTAEQVHELGVMLAEAITSGDYKYVVSTHMDRHHLHNHIVICAANRRSGRKMRLTRRSIDQWRAISDELCRREGLNVLKNPDVEAAADRVDMRGTMRRTPGQNTEPISGYDVPVIESTGRGVDMGELYAAAKGKGIKERMRILIDLDAAKASNIGEFSRLLDLHGIGLAMRGGGATFTDRTTGRKFRGSRLGPAYTLDAIGARLANGENMLHLTFNNKLVAVENDRSVSVWLPGTKRQRKVNLPANMLRRDGSTWHLLIPETFTGMVMDHSNRYAARLTTAMLAEAFGRPEQRLEPLARSANTTTLRHASSPAQRRYYQIQAGKLDELKTMADGLNVACQIQREGDNSLAEGMRNLNARADWARSELRAAVIALNDAINNNDLDLVAETRAEVERREQAVLECQHELDAISLLARNSGIRLPDTTSKERNDGSISEPERQYGNRPVGRHVLPNVRPDAAAGTNEHDLDNGYRRGPVRGGEARTQPSNQRASEQEFDALIKESRASINESAALVNESDAQEAALRTQRDNETTRRNQEERTRLRRKGRAL